MRAGNRPKGTMETEQEAAVATETGQQTGGIAKTDQQQQSGVNAVLRQLLRGLRVAFTQTDSAQEALKDTAKHLDQIGNLAEQFQVSVVVCRWSTPEEFMSSASV